MESPTESRETSTPIKRIQSKALIEEVDSRNKAKEKIRQIEAQQEEKTAELEQENEKLSDLKIKLTEVNTKLDTEDKAAARLALLEQKQELLTTVDSTEAEITRIEEKYDSKALKLTHEEERILRGMKAQKQLAEENTKTQKSETLKRHQSMVNKQTTAGRNVGIASDNKNLEEAIKKQQSIDSLKALRKQQLSVKDKEIAIIEENIKKYQETRKKLTGQEFQDASANLLEMLALLENTGHEKSQINKKYLEQLQKLSLGKDEERVLRGHNAMQKKYTAPILPAHGSSPRVHKRIAKDIEAAATRLSIPTKRKHLPEIDRGNKLRLAAQNELSARLHDRELEIRTQKAIVADELQETNFSQHVAKKTLRRDEEDVLIHRVFYEGLVREQEVTKRIVEKWKQPHQSRKLTTEGVTESNNRMFYRRHKNQQELRTLLKKKYIEDVVPTFTKMKKNEIIKSVDRLTSK